MTAWPVVLALHIHEVSAIIVVLVGLLALGLAAVGVRAMQRTGNGNLRFVSLAFGVFGVKGLFGGWAVWTRSVRHEDLELVLALLDLVIILLLVWPLVVRMARPARGAS